MLVFRGDRTQNGTFYQISPSGQILIAKDQNRRDVPLGFSMYQEFDALITRIDRAGVYVPPGCVYDLSEERLPSQKLQG